MFFSSQIVISLLPRFANAKSRDVKAEQVLGGITNVIYKISVAGDDGDGSSVLVRIFGAEGVISAQARAIENSIFAQLAEAELAPSLLGVFANGRIERWLPARRITLDEMRDDEVQRGVAEAMAKLHRFCPAEEQKSQRSTSMWDSIANWISIGRRVNLPSEDFALEELALEVEVMRKVLLADSPASPLVFAHGDLLAANILVSTDGLRRINLIDFEYSSTGYRGFDIGNFFCEAMGGTEDGIVESSKYPSIRSQKLFCRTYLSHDGHHPSEHDVDALVAEANQYGLLAHLYWAAWAVAQSRASTVDFPYLLFGQSRLAQYRANKEMYLHRVAAKL